VQYKESDTGDTYQDVSQDIFTTTTQKSLKALKTYEFSIKPHTVDSVNGSPYESAHDTSAKSLPKSNEARCTPTLVKRSGGMIHIEWNDPLDTGGVLITSYSVLMASEDDVLTTLRASQIVDSVVLEDNEQLNFAEVYSGSDPTFAQGHLSPGTMYFFRMAAINSEGVGPYSSVFTAQTTHPTAPGPSIFDKEQNAGTVTGGLIVLKWAPPFDTGGGEILFYSLSVSKYDANSGTWSTAKNVQACDAIDASALSLTGVAPQTPVGGIKNFQFRKTTTYLSWARGSTTEKVVGDSRHTLRLSSYKNATGECLRIQANTDYKFKMVPSSFIEGKMDCHATSNASKCVCNGKYMDPHHVGSTQECFNSEHEVTTTQYSKPSAPRNVRIITGLNTGGSLTLQWDPPEDFGGYDAVSGYKIYVDGLEPVEGRPLHDVYVFKQTGLEPERMYTLYVSAVVNNVEGPRCSPVQGWTTVVTKPAQLLVPEPKENTKGTITIKWKNTGNRLPSPQQHFPLVDTGGSDFTGYLLSVAETVNNSDVGVDWSKCAAQGTGSSCVNIPIAGVPEVLERKVENLKGDTMYAVRITAKNSLETFGPWSESLLYSTGSESSRPGTPSRVSLSGQSAEVFFLPPEREGGVRQKHYTPWILCLGVMDDNIWMPGTPVDGSYNGEGYNPAKNAGYFVSFNVFDVYLPGLGVWKDDQGERLKLENSIYGKRCEVKIQATNMTCEGQLTNAYKENENCLGNSYIGEGPFSKNMEFQLTLSKVEKVYFTPGASIEELLYANKVQRRPSDNSEPVATVDYSNQQLMQWKISPQNHEYNEVELKFETFALECDYDYIEINVGPRLLWKGGCRRPKFSIIVTLATENLEGELTIGLFSDDRVEYDGIKFTYEAYLGSNIIFSSKVTIQQFDHTTTTLIAPFGPTGQICSGNIEQNGFTADAKCICTNGYVGEDCSATAVRSSGDECDLSKPLNLCEYVNNNNFGSMFAVASFGEDEIGRGSIGIDKVAKPLKSIKFAIALASSKAVRETVLLDSAASVNTVNIVFGGDGVPAGFVYIGADISFADCTNDCVRSVIENTCSEGRCTSIIIDRSPPRTVPSTAIVLRVVMPLVILYPGEYSGEDHCGVTIFSNNIGIRSIRGPTSAVVNCKRESNALTLRNDRSVIVGVTYKNGLTSNSGGAISISKSTGVGTQMFSVVLVNNSALNGGGAISLEEDGLLRLNDVLIEGNEATERGGGIIAENSEVHLTSNTRVINNNAMNGGGVYIVGLGSPSVLSGGLISSNIAGSKGGNVHARGESELNDNIISQGLATFGGGVYVYSGSKVALNNVSITRNKAVSRANGVSPAGGGMFVDSAEVTLRRSTVASCHSDANGGGLHIQGSNNKIVGSLDASILNNYASSEGGGISVENGEGNLISTISVRNNNASNGGGGIYASKGVFLTLEKTSVFQNEAPLGGGIKIDVSDGSAHLVSDLDDSSILQNKASVKGGNVYIVGVTKLVNRRVSLKHFHIESGTAPLGGGVAIDNTRAGFENCLLKSNRASGTSSGSGIGGGIYADSSDVDFANSECKKNYASNSGGGVYMMSAANFHFSGSLIAENEAEKSGGGIHMEGVEGLLDAGSIKENVAENGAGVSIRGGVPSLESLHISFNAAKSPKASIQCSGGGIYVIGVDVVTVKSCVLEKNSAYGSLSGGGGMHLSTTRTMTLENSILRQNVAKFGGGMNLANVALASEGSRLENNEAYELSSLQIIEDVFTVEEAVSDAKYGQGGNCFLSKNSSLDNVVLLQGKARLGGGIYIDEQYYSSSVISRCNLIHNRAAEGGGIYGSTVGTGNSRIDLQKNVFKGNAAVQGEGGAVWLKNFHATSTEVIYTLNQANKGGGGGIYAAEITLFI
jgi:hypothetical protein